MMADIVVPKKFREGVKFFWNGALIQDRHARSKAMYQAAMQSLPLTEFGDLFDKVMRCNTPPDVWEEAACVIEGLFPNYELEVVSLSIMQEKGDKRP